MQTVILAGGLGTRLRPLTYQTPKAMISIKGKPFLEYQLKVLKSNGLNDILICIGHLGSQVKKYFGDGRKWELNIKYSFENKLLGTGGALKNAEDYLESEFLVLYGDTFLAINYENLIRYFHKEKKLGVMVIYKNKTKIFKNNVRINEKKEIINYNKKNENGANCIDAGILVFKKDILESIPPNKIISLEEEIFPILIQKKQLIAYPTNQKFYDIGTFERLKKFNQTL